VNKAPPPASNPQQDEEAAAARTRDLVNRAKGGDQEAFGELVQIYHQRVFSVAYRFVRNEDEANDMTQQAWIKAWKKLDGFKGQSEFFTWMYRVVSFVCLDHLRKKRRRGEMEYLDEVEAYEEPGTERAASTVSRPDHELERREIRERFEAVLNRISPEQRMALTLREVEGLSYEEIASAMNCRKGTVMSRIFYARKNLQQYMKDLQ